VLLAAREELTIQALDYSLKQLRYRFNVASLNNAVLGSRSIIWTGTGYLHPTSDAAQRELRSLIPVVPSSRRADGEFEELCCRLHQEIKRSLRERAERLRRAADPTRLIGDWE
jgi:hypothetical protein